MTLEALAEVHAGRLHNHAVIRAWARDLGKPKLKRGR
jgi:hypothetical protein